jgi:hypothetical protein
MNLKKLEASAKEAKRRLRAATQAHGRAADKAHAALTTAAEAKRALKQTRKAAKQATRAARVAKEAAKTARKQQAKATAAASRIEGKLAKLKKKAKKGRGQEGPPTDRSTQVVSQAAAPKAETRRRPRGKVRPAREVEARASAWEGSDLDVEESFTEADLRTP